MSTAILCPEVCVSDVINMAGMCGKPIRKTSQTDLLFFSFFFVALHCQRANQCSCALKGGRKLFFNAQSTTTVILGDHLEELKFNA